VTDVLLVSLGSTTGLREADAELAASMRRAGAEVAVAVARRPREMRTYALLELAWALAARRAAAAAVAERAPRAVVYSSVTAALLGPVPGAIRFDSLAAANRPGRHGVWQRPVERRRLAAAPLLMPWSEGAFREAPRGRAEAVVVPVPVAPSGAAGERDIAAITYGANPSKKGLGEVLAAWVSVHQRDEELVVTGVDRRVAEEEFARVTWRRRPAGVRYRLTAAREALDRARVRFVGMVARDEHRALLRRARVFVTAPRREDYGIAQLEALADGCALVTTAGPGPYVALPLARELDGRLVGDDLGRALRLALDEPVAGYAERAASLLGPWRPSAVDRVVSDELLPRLLR
jgi:Glycosyl transferases group 1